MSNSNYSVNNSSISPLGISESFTGYWESTQNSRSVHLSLETDQDGDFQIDFTDEPDRGALHVDHHHIKVKSNIQEVRDFHVLGRYFRVIYTNGLLAQSSFKMYISLRNGDEVKTTQGYENNLMNDETLALLTSSNSLDILHMNQITLLYQDSSTGNFDGIDVEVSLDNVNWWTIQNLFPVVKSAVRQSLVQIYTHGLRYLRITNPSSMNDNLNVYCSVVGIN